jgi:hypothetical protein
MAKAASVAEHIKKLIREADEDAKLHHVRRVRQWVKNFMFYRGNHFGDFDRNGNWVQLPDNQTEDLRFTDDFFFYVEAKATQWTQSQPELSINPTSTSVKQQRAASNHAKKELEEYRKRFWKDDFKQRMAKYAMLSTCYFINTRPKLSDKSVSVLDIGLEKEVSGDDMYLCSKCGWSGTMPETADMPSTEKKCPECGAPLVKQPGVKAKASIATGTTQIPEVDIEVELVDPMEMKIDSKCRGAFIPSADWIRRERYIRDYEVEEMYPDWDKNVDDQNSISAPERSDVLNYKRALEQSIGGLTYDNKADENATLRRQYWFDKKTYKNYKVPADEHFAGTDFKKGEILGEKFPSGLYVDQMNNACKKLFNEDKNRTWVGSVDTIDPTQPYGRGFSGMVNIQEMLDEGVSLSFAYLMRDALGLQLYDPTMVESSDVQQTRVGGAIPLKPGAVVEGKGISAALINVEHKALSQMAMPFIEYLDSKMPHAAGGAYDILGGGAGTGAGADTASGQNQQLQTAAGMIGPALQLRAAAEVQAFYQYLEQIQKFGSDDHFQRIAGDWGMMDAKAFKEIDVRHDLKIVPITNSEVPRTQQDRRNDVAVALSTGLANPEIPMFDNIRSYGLEQLRIPVEDDPKEQMVLVGEAMLEKMKQASKYIQAIGGSQTNPQELAAGVAQVAPLSKHRDKDAVPVIQSVLVEYLRSLSESMDVDPVLQLAVEMKLDEIEMFQVKMSMSDNAKATMAQAPMAIAQAKLQQASQAPPDDGTAAKVQAQAQTQQKAAETQLEMQKDQYKAQLAAHSKSMDMDADQAQRDHEASMADREQDFQSGENEADRAHETRMYLRKKASK